MVSLAIVLLVPCGSGLANLLIYKGKHIISGGDY